MSDQSEPNPPPSRDRARSRLSGLTKASILTAVGVTAGLGVLVAHEHPGAASRSGGSGSKGSGSTSGTSNSGSSSSSSRDGSTGDTGDSGNSGDVGNTGNTGGFSTAPSSSSSRPSVVSGGTS